MLPNTDGSGLFFLIFIIDEGIMNAIHTSVFSIIRTIIILFSLLQAIPNLAQTSLPQPTESSVKEQHLLGKCSLSDFKKAPFNTWFEPGMNAYTPNAHIVQELKQTSFTRLHYRIFLGTWCGDSQREIPRFLKLLQELGIKEESIEIIAVSNADSTMKRSPTGEEKNADIFRVPTVQIFEHRNNPKQTDKLGEKPELARIVEYPLESWERDLLRIAQQREPYTANYHTYPIIRQWLHRGILSDTNVSVNGLANRLRYEVTSEGELNACAWVLLSRGQIQEAVTILRINAIIYAQSSRALENLAEGYEKLGKPQNAIRSLERALELDTKNLSALKAIVRLKAKAL